MDEQQQNQNQSAGERLTESLKEQKTPEQIAPQPVAKHSTGGMNKFLIIGIVLALFLVGGIVWSTFFSSKEKVVETGVTRDITITTHENTWNFDPEEIEVNQGDRVRLTVVNQDEYDHGFAIDAYGISQRMPAKGTILVEFVATRAGVFPYYCSVSCGSGEVDGVERGHFDQIGKLHVRSLISETTDYQEVSDEELREQARRAGIKREADSAVEALGFDANALMFVFDENNSAWEAHLSDTLSEEHEKTLTALEGLSFYSVYYTDAARTPVVWVFIDDTTGDIITHKE